VIQLANTYVASNPANENVAACTIKWLHTWAKSDALLGDVNYAGTHVRKWSIGIFASAYLQIHQSPSLKPQTKKSIQTWLQKLGRTLQTEQDQILDRKSGHNNHLFWKAWSAGITAVALQDQDMFDWAMRKAQIGLYQIDQNGALPLELIRGTKALHYHVFSTHALVMLAELAAINGAGDFYTVHNNALKRLITFTLDNIENPAAIESLNGKTQETENLVNASTMAWLELYTRRHQSHKAQALLETLRPMHQLRTGGNMTLLFAGIPVD